MGRLKPMKKTIPFQRAVEKTIKTKKKFEKAAKERAVKKKPSSKHKEESEDEEEDVDAPEPFPTTGVECEETSDEWEKERKEILKKIKGKNLDFKIKMFRELFLAKEGVENRGRYLKLFFKGEEMSKLWGRLKTAMKGAVTTVRDEWDKINQLPARCGKDQKKANILAFQLALPDGWQQAVGQEVRTAGTRTSLFTKKKEKYWGELKQKHGEEEAKWMIDTGKYVKTTNKQGEEVYVRSEVSEVTENYKDQGLTLKKTSELTDAEVKNMEKDMDEWINNKRNSSQLQLGQPKQKKVKNEENKSSGKDKDAEKDPAELARKKAATMARLVDVVGTKILRSYNAVPASKLSATTKQALKDQHGSLETFRKEIQALAASRKVAEKDLRKKIMAGAVLVKDIVFVCLLS